MKLRLLTFVFALVLTTAGVGCFGILGSRSPQESAAITVLNDMDPSGDMTIVLRTSGGDESTLGTVPAGAERTLTHQSRSLQGAYQLLARQSSGAALTSREFTLFRGAEVRWQMRTNNVSVSQPR